MRAIEAPAVSDTSCLAVHRHVNPLVVILDVAAKTMSLGRWWLPCEPENDSDDQVETNLEPEPISRRSAGIASGVVRRPPAKKGIVVGVECGGNRGGRFL